MYKLTSKLIIYSGVLEDSILARLSDVFRRLDSGECSHEQLRSEIYTEVRRLLELATKYGFDNNLWHNYLAYLMMTDENPFSLTYEKAGKQEGTVNVFALNDFTAFKSMFDYDFSAVEEKLGINCFTVLSDYQAISKREQIYNKNVSEKVRRLSKEIEQAEDGEGVFEAVTAFYQVVREPPEKCPHNGIRRHDCHRP